MLAKNKNPICRGRESQSDKHWNIVKGNVREVSERRDGACMGFPERLDLILTWNEQEQEFYRFSTKVWRICPALSASRYPPNDRWVLSVAAYKHASLDRPAGCPSTSVIGLQWGAADAEIEVHLMRTQSSNVLPLKPGVGQYVAIRATHTARDFFLAYFYPSGPFTCIFSKPSPDFSCVGCG